MKLNISNPATGGQKIIEIDDEKKLRALYDKRISHEIDGAALGDEYKGYVFRISGGNDKQGFPMLQGVLTAQRIRLLFTKGMKTFRPRKRGERKRKSVRGCIVSNELSVVNLVVVKKGDNEIAGVTDEVKPRRLGPKRASKIRKLFNLEKKDDVRQYVIRRQVVKEGKKPRTRAPKIQRLVTPERLQHRRERRAVKKQRVEKSRKEAEAYNTILAQRLKEQREKRKHVIAKKRSQSRLQSEGKDGKDGKKEQPKKGDTKKGDTKKGDTKKGDTKKGDTKKKDAKKGDTKKGEAKKDAKKEQPKKGDTKKGDGKKDAKKEQPKKEQPKKEQPKKEQPKKEQPKKEQPKEQPKKEQPKKEQPKKEQPKKEQPKKEQPKKEQPKKDAAKGKK